METSRTSGRNVLKDCIFCNIEKDRIVRETEYFVVIRDIFTVSKLHSLLIPKRHIEDYFDLTTKENTDLFELLKDEKNAINKEDPMVTGYNVGMNCGEDAGQTIFHCHIHLIPRRKGDTAEPRGGVRGVIAGKQSY